jgi:hypothetical protein
MNFNVFYFEYYFFKLLLNNIYYTFSHFKRPFLYNNETYIKTKLKIYIFIHDLFWL